MATAGSSNCGTTARSGNFGKGNDPLTGVASPISCTESSPNSTTITDMITSAMATEKFRKRVRPKTKISAIVARPVSNDA